MALKDWKKSGLSSWKKGDNTLIVSKYKDSYDVEIDTPSYRWTLKSKRLTNKRITKAQAINYAKKEYEDIYTLETLLKILTK